MAQLGKEVVKTFYSCFYCLFNKCKIQFFLLHGIILMAQYVKKKENGKISRLIYLFSMKKKTETCKNSFSFSNNDVPCFRRVQGLVQVDLKTNASCITPAQTSLNSDSFVPLIPPCLVFFFVTVCVVTTPASAFSGTSLSVELAHAPEE